MKKFLLVFACVLTLTLSAGLLTGCGNAPQSETDSDFDMCITAVIE